MKNLLIGILVLIALCSVSFVSADGCFVNEECSWWATIQSSSGLYDADSANITITDPSGTKIVDNVLMSELEIGTFIYTYTHNITGNYLGYTEFVKNNSVISVASQSMQVKIPEIGATSAGKNMNGLLLLIAIFAIGCVLLFAAYKIQLEDYGVLQIFLIICAIIAFLLVPKVALDYNDHCSLLPTNMSSEVSGLTYNYDYVCVENEKSTATTFYVFITWITRILAFYAFIYGMYKLYKHIKDRTKW